MRKIKNNKYTALSGSFLIMLFLGSIYGWSVFVPEMKTLYGLSSAQTQLIFGLVLLVFPVTMLGAGFLEKKFGLNRVIRYSSFLFFAGYFTAGISGGSFPVILTGIGVLGGLGIGLGYMAGITIPARKFPDHKGLATGFSVAGFGLGAVLISFLHNHINLSLPNFFIFIALLYGSLMFIISFLIETEPASNKEKRQSIKIFLKSSSFIRLFIGIFAGTFSGLLIIGNIKSIGELHLLEEEYLFISVSVFAVSNFLGRVSWGYASDLFNLKKVMVTAFIISAVSMFALGNLTLSGPIYLILVFAAGFSFGGNFVLFAKGTIQYFGIENIGIVYPYVFLGYAFSGLIAPVAGGFLFDIFNNYSLSSILASLSSLAGIIIVCGNRNYNLIENDN